jgi:hypothetical protein
MYSSSYDYTLLFMHSTLRYAIPTPNPHSRYLKLFNRYANRYATLKSLKPIINPSTLLLLPPLIIDIPPPLVRLPTRLAIRLLPRLRTQYIMHILDLLIPPNRIVHALVPQRLERIVRIRQCDPASVEQIAQQRLISEIIVARRFVGELLEDEVVGGERGVYDLQAAVGHAQTGC